MRTRPPLIGLARIDRLDLLAFVSVPAYVTARVWQEVTHAQSKPDVLILRQARDEGHLVVVDEGDSDAFPELDAGESTVLSAAAARRAMVVIDERKAQALIESDTELRRAEEL